MIPIIRSLLMLLPQLVFVVYVQGHTSDGCGYTKYESKNIIDMYISIRSTPNKIEPWDGGTWDTLNFYERACLHKDTDDVKCPDDTFCVSFESKKHRCNYLGYMEGNDEIRRWKDDVINPVYFSFCMKAHYQHGSGGYMEIHPKKYQNEYIRHRGYVLKRHRKEDFSHEANLFADDSAFKPIDKRDLFR